MCWATRSLVWDEGLFSASPLFLFSIPVTNSLPGYVRCGPNSCFIGAQLKCIWVPPWKLLFRLRRGVPISASVPRFPSQPLSMTLEKTFILQERLLSSCHFLICAYFGVSGCSPMVLSISACLGIDWETCINKGYEKSFLITSYTITRWIWTCFQFKIWLPILTDISQGQQRGIINEV